MVFIFFGGSIWLVQVCSGSVRGSVFGQDMPSVGVSGTTVGLSGITVGASSERGGSLVLLSREDLGRISGGSWEGLRSVYGSSP
ncbi:MAG: hypothetical protein H7X99_01610 [Saprospiraceae bacterium]|nr:hypothetical protein [Saprospiraceae bacterium]